MTTIEYLWYTQFPILFTQHRTTHINTFWINYPSITLPLTVKQPLQNPTNTKKTHYWVENFFLKLQPATGEPYSWIPLLNIQEKCPHLCFPEGKAVEHPWNYLLAMCFLFWELSVQFIGSFIDVQAYVFWCSIRTCLYILNINLSELHLTRILPHSVGCFLLPTVCFLLVLCDAICQFLGYFLYYWSPVSTLSSTCFSSLAVSLFQLWLRNTDPLWLDIFQVRDLPLLESEREILL